MANYNRGPKPETVENYPTERDRLKHRAFLVARCQAKFRQEEWDLDERDYFELWEPHWDNRGRHTHGMVMTRIDWEKPWHKDNIEFMERRPFLQRAVEWQMSLKGA